MSRETFYRRVREAVRSSAAHRADVRTDLPESVGYVGGGDDLASRMANEVTKVGGVAHLVDEDDHACEVLTTLLRARAATTALCWRHPLLKRLGLEDLLDSLGVEFWNHARLAQLPADEQRVRMLAADVGITSATHAVAETGSLVLASAPGRERATSLLPAVHIAVIERAQIVGDLFDLFDALGHDGVDSMPTNLTLVTGPSKTGDIELQLTTGVHGPGQCHVVIVDR